MLRKRPLFPLKRGGFQPELFNNYRTYTETGLECAISWFEQQYNRNKPGFLVALRKSCINY